MFVRESAVLGVITPGRCPNSLVDRYHDPGAPARGVGGLTGLPDRKRTSEPLRLRRGRFQTTRTATGPADWEARATFGTQAPHT